MRLEQLQYLLDIRHTQSITNTAQRFFVTQQAVSSSLKQLEGEMGATLLDRRPAGVTLTIQGQLAVGFAERVLADFEQTRAAISLLTEEREEPLQRVIRLCSASVLNNIVMPKVLNVAAKREKNLNVNIMEEEPAEVFKQLAAGGCDIGLISINTTFLNAQLKQPENSLLRCQVLMKDKLVACMSTQSPYAQQEMITAEQVQTMAKTVYGVIPIERHKKSAIEGSITCSNDIEFHKKMLLQNDIFTLMPQVTYLHLFKSKKLTAKPLQLKETVEITHGLLYREDADEVVHAFITLIGECLRRV